MIDQVNTLIELNLRILYTTKNNFLNLKDFRNHAGEPFKDPTAFIRLLRIKKLLSKPDELVNCYQLTEFGKEICENGGWLKHLQKQIKIQSEKVEIEPKKIKKKLLKGLFYNSLFKFHKQIL